MKIVIGSDHGGLTLKKSLIEELTKKGFDIEDIGTHTTESCSYAEIAEKACKEIVSSKFDRGILVCGTGIGISIAANKVKGIRAAAVQDHFAAYYTRLHNDSNVLCLGERITGPGAALDMAISFLTTEFEGGRHQTRIDQITKLEN